MTTERPFEGVWRKHCGAGKYNVTINRNGRHNYSGYTDAKLTSRLREDILRILERYDAGEAITTKGLSPRAIEILVDLGALTSAVPNLGLLGLLDQYTEILRSRRDGEAYIKQAKARIRRVLVGCKFKTPQDIDANKTALDIAKFKLSVRTANHYLRSLKGFTGWLFKSNHLPTDPLKSLSLKDAEADRKLIRRTLTNQEFALLLQATTGHNKLPAESRRMVYLIARWSGLRASEVGSLEVSSFDIDGQTPVVTVAATISKRRKLDRQILPAFLVPEIREFLRDRSGKLFPGNWRRRAGEMLKADLEAAGIDYKNSLGQADFHALRHAYVSALAKSGMRPKTLQKFARHSTIVLTMGVYAHVEEQEMVDELEAALSGGGGGCGIPPGIPRGIPEMHTMRHDEARGSTDEEERKRAG